MNGQKVKKIFNKNYQKKVNLFQYNTRHILPKGFTRIRHYGILSSSLKKVILPIIEKDIGKVVFQEKEPIKHGKCPICKTGSLITILRFDIRGPPKTIHSIGYTINKSIS